MSDIAALVCSLTLQTDEAKVSMRFGELMDGPRNKIIVISDVAKGSEAEKVRSKLTNIYNRPLAPPDSSDHPGITSMHSNLTSWQAEMVLSG